MSIGTKGSARSRPPGTCLAIGDDRDGLRLLAASIESLGVLVTRHGSGTLATLRADTTRRFDVVAVDIDGYLADPIGTLRFLALAPSTASATRCVITASPSRPFVIAAREAGADMMWLKPLRRDEIARRLGFAGIPGNPVFTSACSDAPNVGDTASPDDGVFMI